jgi:drug/metabolite transporter (DMT)-like permease
MRTHCRSRAHCGWCHSRHLFSRSTSVPAGLIGFVGALFMLQPSASSGVGWPVVASLLSAFLVALTVAGMKFMTRDHTTTTLMSWSAALGFVLSVPPALFVWRTPAFPDLLLLSAMGVLGVITQACYIRGMSEGDAAVMAPIDYTRLVFAVALGYFLFNELPNRMTLLGAGVIIGSTIYITWREARLGKPKLTPQRED